MRSGIRLLKSDTSSSVDMLRHCIAVIGQVLGHQWAAASSVESALGARGDVLGPWRTASSSATGRIVASSAPCHDEQRRPHHPVNWRTSMGPPARHCCCHRFTTDCSSLFQRFTITRNCFSAVASRHGRTNVVGQYWIFRHFGHFAHIYPA